jgi:hypothetical protein
MLIFNILLRFCGLIFICESNVIIRCAYPVEVSIHTDWYDHYGVGLFFTFHKCYPRFTLWRTLFSIPIPLVLSIDFSRFFQS